MKLYKVVHINYFQFWFCWKAMILHNAGIKLSLGHSQKLTEFYRAPAESKLCHQYDLAVPGDGSSKHQVTLMMEL